MKNILTILFLLFITTISFNCRRDPPINNVSDTPNDPLQSNCWDITDWSGLMNDSQLTSIGIISIPLIDTNYIVWLNNRNNRVDIRSLTSDNFADLQCLKQYFANKTLVQLGESSHGTKQYSQIKVRLIKFMHEQMGFDVIAFESGFFECYLTNQNITQMSEIQAMKSSIYGTWTTQDVKELFTYIKATQSTSNPLILAGFDCYFTSNLNTIYNHSSVLYEIISKVDSQFACVQRSFDSITINQINSQNKTYLSQYNDSIKTNYQRIIDFIDVHSNEFIAAFPQKPVYPLFLRQSINSILANIDYLLHSDTTLAGNPIAYQIRDSAMAANVAFIKEKLYPQKKIILWAHNYHIANSAYNHALYPNIKNMGIYLKEKYFTDLYTVGLYMLKGETKTDWNWTIINIPTPTTSNSLEAILYSCRKKSIFIDLSSKPYSFGNKWMYNTITAKTSGFADESMIIRNVYDGIIYIDSSSVPVYLN
jgi:erythromycin esterase